MFHCDVNPSNILVNTDTSEILLVDWACSRQEASQTSKVSDCRRRDYSYSNTHDCSMLVYMIYMQILTQCRSLGFLFWANKAKALQDFDSLFNLKQRNWGTCLLVQAWADHLRLWIYICLNNVLWIYTCLNNLTLFFLLQSCRWPTRSAVTINLESSCG